MPSRLYVGNLSYSTTEDSLRQFFTTAGEVKTAEVVMDRQTNRSKGFAFVEMMTDDGAQKAIATLNGKTLDSRQLRIDIAKPKEQRARVGGAGGYNGGGERNRYSGGRSNRDEYED
ncbi:MAG: RNA-binding protein [Chloroflexi bacterium]|nr:RNA-binding protein [Chloroflexota bacterium]MCL5273929.1 RNA-binding protein [Chloroflexota bacterium]